MDIYVVCCTVKDKGTSNGNQDNTEKVKRENKRRHSEKINKNNPAWGLDVCLF
jgi:hypothetical protein